MIHGAEIGDKESDIEQPFLLAHVRGGTNGLSAALRDLSGGKRERVGEIDDGVP